MAAAQAGRGGKGGVRKVNPKAGKKGYGRLMQDTPENRAKAGQSASDRRKTYQRSKATQKRDAIRRGAEGPKRRSR